MENVGRAGGRDALAVISASFLMQLSRSLISEVGLAPHGRAIHPGTSLPSATLRYQVWYGRLSGRADSVLQPPRAEPNNPASRPRQLLPKDLAASLARMDDAEIDFLLEAVSAEAKRRGRLTPTPPKHMPTLDPRSQAPEAAAEEGARLMRKGKLNAVRAAFNAGCQTLHDCAAVRDFEV